MKVGAGLAVSALVSLGVAGGQISTHAVTGIAARPMAATAARSAGTAPVHLTAAQGATLQREVDAQLPHYGGGRQIGVNQVSYQGGHLILTLPLPGESRARAVNEAVTPYGVANCSYEWACLWTETNFNGTRLARYHCGTVMLSSPFDSSTGSIHNNQTTGTQTVLLNAGRQILNASLAPSRINDTGVGSRWNMRSWTVC